MNKPEPSKDNELPEDLIDIPAAAKLCHGTHRHTIRRWILQGKIPGYRVGQRKMLVSKRELLAIIRPIVPQIQPTVPTAAQKRKHEEWVDARLREEGIRK
jgi:excisionase family DNA binding protein